MYEITKRYTSEYAIRPYLIANSDRCMMPLDMFVEKVDSVVVRIFTISFRSYLG